MIRLTIAFICAVLLSACGSSSGDTTTYKYQISGTSSAASASLSWNENKAHLMSLDEQVWLLSNNFILKWNEDSSSNVTGVYINQTTGETLAVTGTSNGSGRELTATRASPINGVLALKFIVKQTGDLNGSINATLKAYDANSAQVGSDESITVTASTTGSSGESPGGSSGSSSSKTAPLTSYTGLYTGTMTEVSNQTVAGGIGNGKYCDFTFSGAELKFELSSYLKFGYSTRYSQGDGAYGDVTAATNPASLTVVMDQGYPSATLLDYGYHNSGVKITAADQSGGKKLTITFVGAFSETPTKKLTGTLTAKLDSVAVCEFTVNMTKQ